MQQLPFLENQCDLETVCGSTCSTCMHAKDPGLHEQVPFMTWVCAQSCSEQPACLTAQDAKAMSCCRYLLASSNVAKHKNCAHIETRRVELVQYFHMRFAGT